MKKIIISFVTGALLFGAAGVFAGQYIVSKNPFTIKLNGENINIEGYNINGSTYFKLRDISSALGSFNVDFSDNTILISNDGYEYYNNSNDSDIILKNYAKENIWKITNENNYSYSNVKFLITDVTGDEKNDLLAVGFQDDDDLGQLEVYIEENGNVKKILNDHCGGYNGGLTYPVKYKGKVYICCESYSSGTGFLKRLIKYKNYDWVTEYSSNIVFDDESGKMSGYNVNDNSVSAEEFDSFNKEIEDGTLTINDFLSRNEL